jgi:hypothetical protein
MAEKEETYLEFIRAITTDAHGNEVRVGLTVEETAFYLAYLENRRTGRPRDSAARARFQELHEKHEYARLNVIVAEAELRQKPSVN